MEDDALTVESVDMNWELESSTIEEVDFKYVRFNDIVDVSFVDKEENKPWKPTTKHFEYKRMVRRRRFDPIESRMREALNKNALFMKGCTCATEWHNEDVCYWCSRFGFSASVLQAAALGFAYFQ